MKTRYLLFLLCISSLGSAQILTKPPAQKIVPVPDTSGLIMDIYKQTNAQNAQLSAMQSQMTDIKEAVNRIEATQGDSEKSMDGMRHDIDKQGVIANLFVYSVQTFFTIIVAICVTVPGTFLVQKVLNERFSKPLTPPSNPE